MDRGCAARCLRHGMAAAHRRGSHRRRAGRRRWACGYHRPARGHQDCGQAQPHRCRGQGRRCRHRRAGVGRRAPRLGCRGGSWQPRVPQGGVHAPGDAGSSGHRRRHPADRSGPVDGGAGAQSQEARLPGRHRPCCASPSRHPIAPDNLTTALATAATAEPTAACANPYPSIRTIGVPTVHDRVLVGHTPGTTSERQHDFSPNSQCDATPVRA